MKADNRMSREEYEALTQGKKRKPKYRSTKTEACGIVFDSRREANRYTELKMLEETGEISDIRRQVKYELIPKQIGDDGRVIERACDYKADFVYTTRDEQTVVEDTKGIRTTAYVIKRKLMLYKYGIRIHEV